MPPLPWTVNKALCQELRRLLVWTQLPPRVTQLTRVGLELLGTWDPGFTWERTLKTPTHVGKSLCRVLSYPATILCLHILECLVLSSEELSLFGPSLEPAEILVMGSDQ